jgi:hypothetical protein
MPPHHHWLPTVPSVVRDAVEALTPLLGAEACALRVGMEGDAGADVELPAWVAGTALPPALVDAVAEGRPALDRFRVAAVAVWSCALAPPRPAAAPSWWATAHGAARLDAAVPALGLGWAALDALLAHPEQGLDTRPWAGLWWVRSPAAEEGALPTTAAWAAFGAWLRSPSAGPRATCPFGLGLGNPEDTLPATAAAWSHRWLRVPPGRRRAEPHAAIVGARAAGPGRPEIAVVGVGADGQVPTVAWQPAGPVGAWVLDSGQVGAQVGAARGVEIAFGADGRAELTAVDAFVGRPVRALLDLAETMGVTGGTSGRWEPLDARADGCAGRIAVKGWSTRGATVRGRGRGGFALPADGWLGAAEAVLAALQAGPLDWSAGEDGRLVVEGPLFGARATFFLSPAPRA